MSAQKQEARGGKFPPSFLPFPAPKMEPGEKPETARREREKERKEEETSEAPEKRKMRGKGGREGDELKRGVGRQRIDC